MATATKIVCALSSLLAVQGIAVVPMGSHNRKLAINGNDIMDGVMDYTKDVNVAFQAHDLLSTVLRYMTADFAPDAEEYQDQYDDHSPNHTSPTDIQSHFLRGVNVTTEDVEGNTEVPEVQEHHATSHDIETSSNQNVTGAHTRGMLMKLEIKRMKAGQKFFVRFDHGCKPTAGKVVVNCIFKLGEKVKYMWAFRGGETVEKGDSMSMTLVPKIAGKASSSFLKRKAFTGHCPACGSKCRTRYGDMKMELPLAQCDAPADVGFHTIYRVPKEMPDITFQGRMKMQKANGTIVSDLLVTWAIGNLKKLRHLSDL